MNDPDMTKNHENLSAPDASDGITSSSNQGASGATRDSVNHNWHNMDNRLVLISECAYFKAEKRGFIPGYEVADWLEAEKELAEIMGEA